VNAHVGSAGTDNFNVAVRGQLEYYKWRTEVLCGGSCVIGRQLNIYIMVWLKISYLLYLFIQSRD
jgi:hypothetical protein